MDTQTKKCPMCAETIPLVASVCEYCATRFEVSITGYCPACHQVREADTNGCCKTCNGEIIDPRVESRMVEEPVPAAPERPVPARPPSSRTWLWTLGAVLILGAAGLAWGLSPKLAPAIIAASATPTVTETPSASPTPAPTRTPRPTGTATPIPAWVADFSVPILQAIKDRSPDFEDNFTDKDGWYIATGPNGDLGSLEIINGSLQMSVTAKPGAEYESAHAWYPGLRYGNFVLQVEADMSQINAGDTLKIHWRGGVGVSGAGFYLARNGGWNINFSASDCSTLLPGGVLKIQDKVTIRIISRGTEYAVYLDQIPLGYVNDLGRRPAKTIELGVYASRGNTATVKYDNLKVWDISRIPIP